MKLTLSPVIQKVSTAIALAFLASSAGAQQVIDGSDTAVEPGALAKVIQQIGQRSGDLQSAQFRGLHRGSGGSVVCGEVRNSPSDAAAFSPFYFDVPSGRGEIMPDPSSTDFDLWLTKSGLLCH